MRRKWLFWIIACILSGSLIGIGWVFFREDITSLWVIEGIAMIAILLAVLLYQKLIKPYNLILSGMQLLNEQDFSTSLRPVKNKDADQLISVFNRMITHLRHERLLVREKNQFLDLLINASPQGIIILNFDRRITEANASGLKLLGVDSLTDIQGLRFDELTFELAPSLAALKPGEDVIIRGAGGYAYRCVYSSFVDNGFDHPFILIEELSHELIKIEKASYDRIIRMMSHEVNNSVGAIGATLNVVSDIFRHDEAQRWDDVLPAVEASYERCGRLAHFIGNLAEVVKIPEPSLSDISLNEQVRSVYALTSSECRQRDITLTLSLAEPDTLIRVDGIQFEQVLVNIIKNAYEAIGTHGEIRIATTASPLSIRIENNGPAIDEAVRQKLFTPFFTTKTTGHGIGLMFVRDVLINHHCKFNLSSQDGWTRFEILFT